MVSPALEISNLRKHYQNGIEALKGITLTVNQGDFFALLGANGAGKSTTIGIVTTLIPKTSGQVKLFGHDIDHNITAAKSLIGVVPQEFNFNQFETVENILYDQAGYYGLTRRVVRPRVMSLLKQLDLLVKRTTPARRLSGGMKRRLMIARALVNDPKLLILDEPTAGVDIEIRHAMWDFLTTLNKAGKTIILTTHYLEEAESLCRNIAILDHGRVIKQGDMSKLLGEAHEKVLLLETVKPVHHLPVVDRCTIRIVAVDLLEVTMPEASDINALFSSLTQQGIQVKNLRSKTNRLESLFLHLTKRERT